MLSGDEQARAWAYLSRVAAEPPNPLLNELVAAVGVAEAADRVRRRAVDEPLRRVTEARFEIDCAREDLEVVRRLGGRLLTPQDDDWPHVAFAGLGPRAAGRADAIKRGQAHAPLALWMLGDLPLAEVSTRAAALVGTRAATHYGEFAAADLAAGLVERDVTVVSGAAYGIDGAAHRSALASDGVTVAVLACGIDVSYPSGHSALLHRIARHGVVLSEYPPGFRPTRRQFLARNRLVAALSGATVVVEAGARSGAANTASWANLLGRGVCAVPGPVSSTSSVGCHILIRAGATLVTRAAEIVELVGRMGELAPEPERPATVVDDLDPVELTVYDALPRRGSRTVEEIAVIAGIPVADVLGPLAMLDVRGLVRQSDGCWKVAPR